MPLNKYLLKLCSMHIVFSKNVDLVEQVVWRNEEIPIT